MQCLLCKKETSYRMNKKYCGPQDLENSCAWKVKSLQMRMTSIKERCLNPKHENYKHYRDVKICDQWLENKMSFVLWALANGWEDGLQIDRKDNNKGYSPENCRFVTRKVNCRNKRITSTDWDNKTRKCRICKTIKPFGEMAISRKEIGGLAYECRLCKKNIDRLNWINGKTSIQKKHPTKRLLNRQS